MVTPATQTVVLVQFPFSDLITAEIGKLKADKHRQIIAAVVALLEGRAP